MSPKALSINATFVRKILTMVAVVYTRDAAGLFTVSAVTGLACRLDLTGSRPSAPRSEDAGDGTLRWDATVTFAEHGTQIAVDAYPGDRWNPIPGTARPDILPGIGLISRTIAVEQAET